MSIQTVFRLVSFVHEIHSNKRCSGHREKRAKSRAVDEANELVKMIKEKENA